MDLMEDLDPEQARALVDPALELMIEATHRYDGYVVQSTGDGVFALFGAPMAHEDHAHRAIYAALRMQDEMRRYSAQLREQGSSPIEIRIGVNTGEVVVRSIRTDDTHVEYTPIGHATSLAARMQALAPTGAIAITDNTYRLVAGFFEMRPLGPARVKGVTEPVNVYEVAGIGPLRTRLQRSARRGLSHFIGREHEIAELKRALDSARAGHGQIVAAVADPGIGKSRLFYEFKQMAPSDTAVLEAVSVSHGRATAYLPVIELLKDYFRIGDRDDERLKREKMTGKVLALDRSLEDTLPFLFAMFALPYSDSTLAEMDAQIRRRRTREAVKRIILRESLNQPLILVFEDLHWIDSETQALLDTLVDSIGTARVLMLVNYRPEYRHQWGGKSIYTQLRLDPLGKESAEAMLSALLGLPSANAADPEMARLRRFIIEKTEGNPFFIEEMIQSLFDQGVLVRNGKVTLARGLDSVRIPPTVKGILAARIDRLGQQEKELLQTLSVLGKEFSLGLVRRTLDATDDRVLPILHNLQVSEFIYEQPAFPDVEYTFKHALTQEVAYDSMLIERRRAIHDRVAQAIETMFAGELDDHIGELAHHCGRGSDVDKAVKYLVRAAEQARSRSAYEDAARYLDDALRHLDSMRESAQRDRLELNVQLCRGNILAVTRGFAAKELESSVARVRALCERADIVDSLPVMFGLGWLEFNRGRMREARATAEKTMIGAQKTGIEPIIAGAHQALGTCCLWMGDFALGRDHIEQAVAILDRDVQRYLRTPDVPVVPSRCQLAWVLFMLGYPDQARARIEEALALAAQLGRPFSTAFALLQSIAITNLRRDTANLRTQIETLIEASRENGFPYYVAGGEMSMGRLLIEEGRLDEGMAQLREGLSALIATGAGVVHRYGQILLAESCLIAKRREEGLSTIEAGLRGAETMDHRLGEAELHRLRGELMLLDPRDERGAEEEMRTAIEIAQRQQGKSWELRASTSLARLLARLGRRDEARGILAPVYAWFTEGFDTQDLKDARAILEGLSTTD